MGRGFEATIRDAVRASLFHLTDVERKVQVEEIVVTKSPTKAFILVSFRDLTDPDSPPELLQIPVLPNPV